MWICPIHHIYLYFSILSGLFSFSIVGLFTSDFPSQNFFKICCFPPNLTLPKLFFHSQNPAFSPKIIWYMAPSPGSEVKTWLVNHHQICSIFPSHHVRIERSELSCFRACLDTIYFGWIRPHMFRHPSASLHLYTTSLLNCN